jgi:hypothetical protein
MRAGLRARRDVEPEIAPRAAGSGLRGAPTLLAAQTAYTRAGVRDAITGGETNGADDSVGR